MLLKVKELAKRSGLTGRTLHHYDAIGLLASSERADNGYRLYDRDDVTLCIAYRRCAASACRWPKSALYLSRPGTSLTELIARQIASLDAQIDEAVSLRAWLDTLHSMLTMLTKGEEPALADWLNTLEMMTMFDRYFSKEELDRLPMVRQTQTQPSDWIGLVADVRALMDADVPARLPAPVHSPTAGDDVACPRYEQRRAPLRQAQSHARTGAVDAAEHRHPTDMRDYVIRPFRRDEDGDLREVSVAGRDALSARELRQARNGMAATDGCCPRRAGCGHRAGFATRARTGASAPRPVLQLCGRRSAHACELSRGADPRARTDEKLIGR